VDDFTKDNFTTVCSHLNNYKGLTRLGLELVVFDLEESKETLMSVLKNHRESLRVLSLAKNKVTNALMEHICDGLKDMNVMEVIDLRHLKEAKNVDWVKMLTSISTLSSNRKKNV